MNHSSDDLRMGWFEFQRKKKLSPFIVNLNLNAFRVTYNLTVSNKTKITWFSQIDILFIGIKKHSKKQEQCGRVVLKANHRDGPRRNISWFPYFKDADDFMNHFQANICIALLSESQCFWFLEFALHGTSIPTFRAKVYMLILVLLINHNTRATK